MGKPRLLYYDVLEYDAESLATLDAEFDVIHLRTPDEDRPEVLQGIDAMIAPLGFDCGKAKIDACPKLKAIGSSTTGAPHIDRKHAEEKGVKVIFLGPETEFLDTITCTAEHAWGLLLAVTRRSPWSFQAVQKGKWYRFDWPTPKMLCSLTLGIVGLGRLGRMVATFGKAFRMEVFYYDPYVPESPVPGCIRVESPEELVSKSDVVSLHAHHTPETENMFDRALFAKFRPGSYFINTARGELVDHAALLEALESGHLAAAGLDVLEEIYDKDYNLSVADHPLVQYSRTHDNLLITPHTAGSTVESWHKTRRHTIGMMIDFFSRQGQ